MHAYFNECMYVCKINLLGMFCTCVCMHVCILKMNGGPSGYVWMYVCMRTTYI